MFGKRARRDSDRLSKVEHKLDLVYTALIVRDPGTNMSADAYEGLRKQVVASSTARRQHVAQLADFDVAIKRGASLEDLSNLVSQWLRTAGVERTEDVTLREVWEHIPRSSNGVEVELPAYVDMQTNSLVRQGRLREKSRPKKARSKAVTAGDAAPISDGGESSQAPTNDGALPADAATPPASELPESPAHKNDASDQSGEK